MKSFTIVKINNGLEKLGRICDGSADRFQILPLILDTNAKQHNISPMQRL